MPQSTFSITLSASDDDTDQLGHVSNIRYVGWVQRIATAHSDASGYDLETYRKLGAVFIVRRHEIDYLRPTYAGDRVRLTTWIETWKRASVVRMTSIERLVSADGTVEPEPVALARGKTLWVFVGMHNGRPQRIPNEFRPAFDATTENLA